MLDEGNGLACLPTYVWSGGVPALQAGKIWILSMGAMIVESRCVLMCLQ